MTTRIQIPGREDQVLPGMTLTEDQVVASFAGTVDLSSYESSTSTVNGETVISFTNRTGTKGSGDADAFLSMVLSQIAGASPEVTSVDFTKEEAEPEEVELVNTLIKIPGREAQTIPGMVMDTAQVRAAFSGSVDLSSYDSSETEEGDTLVIEFTNRTGTKGAGDININVAGNVVVNTRINIPGREAQTFPGMVMDIDDVKAAFTGVVDLNDYEASSLDEGDTRVISFANRTGTKG